MMPGIFVRYAATSVDLADTAEEDGIVRELLKVLLVSWKSDLSEQLDLLPPAPASPSQGAGSRSCSISTGSHHQ